LVRIPADTIAAITSFAAVAAVLTLVLALMAPSAALAENWVNFLILPEGVIYVDHDSIDRREGHVSARLESTFPTQQRINSGGRIFTYLRVVDRVDVDCKARVYRNVSRDLYSDVGVEVLSLYEDNPQPVTEQSPQEAMIKAYCR
jgi:hypothetical protein